MAYQAARPTYLLRFDGKDYDLVGTLELIEAIESSFREGIVQIASRIMSMGVVDTSKLAAATFSCSGYTTKARDIAETIFSKGIHSTDFTELQMHLYAFLRITLEPPEMREQMAQTMGELLGKLSTASRGEATKNSASAT